MISDWWKGILVLDDSATKCGGLSFALFEAFGNEILKCIRDHAHSEWVRTVITMTWHGIFVKALVSPIKTWCKFYNFLHL